MAVLVVGAGLAGATHARLLAEAGHRVDVIDMLDHVGGAAADFVDGNGVRVHACGPHLFHTKSTRVFDWLRRFGEWTPFQLRGRAILAGGELVPLPVNLRTINRVFGTALASRAEAEAFLARIAAPIAEPRNAGEFLRARLGDVLTDLFFRPYTSKMWGLELEQMDASVVRRVPIRLDDSDLYFPDDAHQALPVQGYSAIVAAMLDHPLIQLSLRTPHRAGIETGYRHCFNSMAIDEYFGYALGDLPYRSLRFHHHTRSEWDSEPFALRNYTDDGPFTRQTWWHCLPAHLVAETGRRTVTIEQPLDYRDNDNRRFYPVRTADQRYQALYRRYQAMAAAQERMTFIGRCGTYQYLDMDQVINQSMASAARWIAAA